MEDMKLRILPLIISARGIVPKNVEKNWILELKSSEQHNKIQLKFSRKYSHFLVDFT